MRTIILTLLATLGLGVLGGFAFIWSGVYDIAATSPHWPLTYWVMEAVRTRSIKARAAGIEPPLEIADQASVIAGAEHFAAHCASCHGAPGVPQGDIANGLYPKPPNLADAAKRYTPGELFWIVKNGIKMSGMPAWNDHSDGELWSTVAFLEKLPAMSEADYAQLVMKSLTQGGGRHSHGAEGSKPDGMPGMDHGRMPAMTPSVPAEHRH